MRPRSAKLVLLSARYGRWHGELFATTRPPHTSAGPGSTRPAAGACRVAGRGRHLLVGGAVPRWHPPGSRLAVAGAGKGNVLDVHVYPVPARSPGGPGTLR